MESISGLTVKIFADGADKKGMLEMHQCSWISGLTTNPTLMRKAGVNNYKKFALDVLREIKDKPISFEVFADDFNEMKIQAMEIASWGDNVYVKIPIMNTEGKSSTDVIRFLAYKGVKQNITALMTLDQVRETTNALAKGPSSYISVFAGRIADTGRDPAPIMRQAVEIMRPHSQLELIWASPREVLNIFQANEVGCQIITATNDILKKLNMVGKDLMAFSLETVKMFRQDALAAAFNLDVSCEPEEAI